MKIAIDYPAFSIQSYGGVSRYMARLAEALERRGEEVSVFAPWHCNHYLDKSPGSLVNGRFIGSYPPYSRRLMFVLNRMAASRRIRSWQPDLVHESYYRKKGTTPDGCPMVITVHDMIHELFPESFSEKDRNPADKRAAVQRADHIICVSENTRNDLVRILGLPEEKTSVVYHGYDLPADNGGPDPGWRPDRPYLLYVGGREPYKNFRKMVRAFAGSSRLCSEFALVVFGGGAFSAEERSFFRETGVNEGQILKMDGGDELLSAVYRHARAFVFPSLYEGFGMPPLEAMAHQCPVVSSQTSSMPEVIGEAAEFFHPESVAEIRSSMERVAFSDERRRDLIERGTARLARFSWDTCAAETLEVYKRLCS